MMSSTWLTSPPSFAAVAGAPALDQRGDARCQPLQLRRQETLHHRGVVVDGLAQKRAHRQHPLVVLLVVEVRRGGLHYLLGTLGS
jgi:hypothetical protein